MESEHLIVPKTKRGEATLQKIFDAAEVLFYESGYAETSITNITERAGIANGTFYIYFKDKRSLFRCMMERYSQELRRATTVAAAEYKTRYERELHGFKAYIAYMIENPGVFRIILESFYVEPDLFRDYYEVFAGHYSEALSQAMGDGEVIDCDVTVASYLLMGGYTFLGLKYVIFDGKKSVSDEEVEKLFRILSRGLLIAPEAGD